MKKWITLVCIACIITACNQKSQTCEKETCGSEVKDTTMVALSFDNASFYTTDGKFNEEAAKDAIIKLMQYYHYPVNSKTRSLIWVSDYGTGNYAQLGLACIGYANRLDDGYMLQDLFLLPGQMLPEHWHEKVNQYPAKQEGWLVRNGKSFIVGVGDSNLSDYPEIKVPTCHENGTTTVSHVVTAESGDFVPLKEVLSHHWQFAGKEGAIITEVANGHVNEAVRHLDKKINAHFLGL